MDKKEKMNIKLFEKELIGKIDQNAPARNWSWLKIGGKPLFTFFPENEKLVS